MPDVDDERVVGDLPQEKTRSRRWMIWPALIILAFLLGFLPMWSSKRSLSKEFDRTKLELIRQRQLNSLAAAAVYARRGEYETARQNASRFYTEVQDEMDKAESKALTEQERTQIPALLATRDEIITLLSRADPASAEKLSNLYIEYRMATGGSQP